MEGRWETGDGKFPNVNGVRNSSLLTMDRG